MKITFPPFLAICLAILLFSCAAEDIELQSEELKAANLEVYETQDLVGIWDLHSMNSNTAIDLNGDKTSSKNIKLETDCFDTMLYDFKPDGTVITDQAKLYFNTTGITSCKKQEYLSTYSLKDDVLSVKFEDKDGITVNPGKQIRLTDNKQMLHITFERVEASAYINNDSGNSTAVIDTIYTVYKKRII